MNKEEYYPHARIVGVIQDLRQSLERIIKSAKTCGSILKLESSTTKHFVSKLEPRN